MYLFPKRKSQKSQDKKYGKEIVKDYYDTYKYSQSAVSKSIDKLACSLAIFCISGLNLFISTTFGNTNKKHK